MRVLFASGTPFLPQAFGGTESSVYALATALQGRGFEIGVVAGLRSGDWRWLRNRLVSKLSGKDVFTMDTFRGFPVFRGWGTSGIPAAARRFNPDIVLLQSMPGRAYFEAFLQLGLPVIGCIRDLSFAGGNPIQHPLLSYIANSQFVAGRLLRDFGMKAEAISPLIFPERYRVRSTREKVLFVNPVPVKGVEIALALAEARPDIPFDFVECWDNDAALRNSARVRNLKNIHWHKSQFDMKGLYATARLLLMPSRWEEAWGRCATEAQVSGIPVIATRIAGLPESVGSGGILVDQDAPFENWLRALSDAWDDKAKYEALVQAATEYSQRPEIQPETIVDRFVTSINDHVLRSKISAQEASAHV